MSNPKIVIPKDLFDKDIEDLTEQDAERAVDYYRDLRHQWARNEEEKEQRRLKRERDKREKERTKGNPMDRIASDALK